MVGGRSDPDGLLKSDQLDSFYHFGTLRINGLKTLKPQV